MKKCIVYIIALLLFSISSVAFASDAVRFEAGAVYNNFGTLVIVGNFVNDSSGSVKIKSTHLYLTINGRTLESNFAQLEDCNIVLKEGRRTSFSFKIFNSGFGTDRINSWRVFSEVDYYTLGGEE
ncbi:MAG: hypothetical protein H6Q67_1741 [Firmicutes bacterium]|nr:hypothetical protein [Bacillota bacterium]